MRWAWRPPRRLLSPGIHKAYESGVARMASAPALKLLAEGNEPGGPTCGRAALFSIAASDFIADPEGHSEEVFGAASLVIRCADADEMLAVIGHLEGQLTATVHLGRGRHRARPQAGAAA